MKASELIAELEKLIDKYGDLECFNNYSEEQVYEVIYDERYTYNISGKQNKDSQTGFYL